MKCQLREVVEQALGGFEFKRHINLGAISSYVFCKDQGPFEITRMLIKEEIPA